MVPTNLAGGFNLLVTVIVDGRSGSAVRLSYSGPQINPISLYRADRPLIKGNITMSNTTTTELVGFTGINFG